MRSQLVPPIEGFRPAVLAVDSGALEGFLSSMFLHMPLQLIGTLKNPLRTTTGNVALES